MKFKPGKYKTRGGEDVVILSNEYTVDGDYQLVGVIKGSDGKWTADTWTKDGKAYSYNKFEHGDDLLPLDKHMWVNVYSGGQSHKNNQPAIGNGVFSEHEANVLCGRTDRIGLLDIVIRDNEIISVTIKQVNDD